MHNNNISSYKKFTELSSNTYPLEESIATTTNKYEGMNKVDDIKKRGHRDNAKTAKAEEKKQKREIRCNTSRVILRQRYGSNLKWKIFWIRIPQEICNKMQIKYP